MTIYGQSEELVSRCIECDLAEPESLTSLGGSAPGLVDGIPSTVILQKDIKGEDFNMHIHYWSVFRKLNFLEKSTRPDISYAIHQ